MSSYVASGIADSDQTKTSLIAVKLGLTGFILPFFFLSNPILLLGTVEGVSLWLTARAVLTSSIGVIVLSAALQGYLFDHLRIIGRIALLGAGLLFIEPKLTTDVAALILCGSVIAIQLMQRASKHKELAV